MSNRTATTPSEVIHRLPGRLRVRLPRLRHDTAYAADLKQEISRITGVTEVRVNPAASSIVITYQVNLLPEHALLEDLGVATPVEPPAPKSIAINAETFLVQKDLVQRLAVSSQTITAYRNKPDFPVWSRARDPQGISWAYHPAAKSFHPVDWATRSPSENKPEHQHALREEIEKMAGADFGETVGEVVGEGIGALLGGGGILLGGGIGAAIGEMLGEELGEVLAHEGEENNSAEGVDRAA